MNGNECVKRNVCRGEFQKAEEDIWSSNPFNASNQDSWAFTYEEIVYMQRVDEEKSQPLQCHLWEYHDRDGSFSQRACCPLLQPMFAALAIRLICECIILILALKQSLQEVVDILRSGHRRWWKIMRAFPSKILHTLSFAIVLLIVGVRFACGLHPHVFILENVLAIGAVLTTSMHFLFYCRFMTFLFTFMNSYSNI
ncbi:unnamed protein product [Toxocara canis]|uniref:Ion_trans domain-containing protein n=1 Tax=Toxocara canis TaxID=6265 RepID=A0A183TXV8_TOXCA|nr:unnamed protein product [Toxocara canis]